jgi:hypothetical protein
MSAVLNLDHRELYREIRQYLLGLFPDAVTQIVQAFQNNNPTPDNAIVMQVLFDRNMDETSNYYDPANEEAHAQNSVNVRLQLSFYGANAEVRSRTVYTLWKSPYSTSRMELCQPLYSYSRDRRPYINDSNKFEDRWIVDLALQYNPQVTYAQDFTDSVDVTINPATGA